MKNDGDNPKIVGLIIDYKYNWQQCFITYFVDIVQGVFFDLVSTAFC